MLNAPTPRPSSDSGQPPIEASERLTEYAERVTNLTAMERAGTISSDACFAAVTALWVRLARAFDRRDNQAVSSEMETR